MKAKNSDGNREQALQAYYDAVQRKVFLGADSLIQLITDIQGIPDIYPF